MIFPPGTILQQLYLKKQLKKIKPGKFIEVGVGQGYVSKLLCEFGWHGVGLDLNESTLKIAAQTTCSYIENKQYHLIKDNWLHTSLNEPVDLVISSMVIEHLDQSEVYAYFEKCKSLLTPQGKAILFVPASMQHWGIEDEIAGHYRRYSFETIERLMTELDWKILKMSGLTYPLSNILYPLSEWLVKKSESRKNTWSRQKRTEASGNRTVLFKTTFPFFLKLILNEITLYPFYLLQKLNRKHPKSLVIYWECKPNSI